MNGTRYDKSLSSTWAYCGKNCSNSAEGQTLAIAVRDCDFSIFARMPRVTASADRPWRARMYSCDPTKQENSDGRPNLLKTTGASQFSAKNSATAPPKPPTTLCSSSVKTA